MTAPASADDIADRIAAAVEAVSGVAALHGGMFGEVATYLPGRRVAGVNVRPDGTEIHIAVTPDAVVRSTAAEVRSAVRGIVDGPVHVVVEDVADPADDAAPRPDASAESAVGNPAS